MKYFSCFSGIGGFELGIINAYEQMMRSANSQEKVQGTRDTNGQPLERPHIGTEGLSCVGFSEIDKYATQIYQSHFPNHTPYGDITKINAEELPDFDCLVGGFPCQAFSIAGKRKGFEDTRGTLFFELARILQAKQPRLFVFENVKGLLSHDNGKTFSTIIATIDELGYDCQWQVLNSKNHGVPQNRERVYIVGHSRGEPRPEVFPFGYNSEKTYELSGQCSNTLTARYYGGQANGTYVRESKLDAQKQLSENIGQFRIRRLTVVECCRLQGFPDNWCDSVSNSQAYKCLGNAVTVNVVRDIFISILGTALALPAEVQNSSQSENMRSATSVSGSTPE